jgi:trehalose utilization protein
MARVLVWNEHRAERADPAAAAAYPDGIHGALAAAVGRLVPQADVRTATLDDPGHGLDGLDDADVLVWWGHRAHAEVPDEAAARVRDAVLGGMGLVALHSAHLSRPFVVLMGTSCALRWRDGDDREHVWCVAPGHPLFAGVPQPLVLERHEMYGEPFVVPAPEELVGVSWFSGGEVFRSVCVWRRGAGRVVYLSPGHETIPVYHHAGVQRLVANAVQYVVPTGEGRLDLLRSPESPPLGGGT